MNGKTLLNFKQKELGGVFQAYTSNGLTWFVKTGDQVPNSDVSGYEDEEIAYPWELFIKQFIPVDDVAKDTVRCHLEVIQKAYLDKIETIKSYLRF